MKKINVKCPECKKQFSYYDSDFRPFCSENCKNIDMGKWFTESYVVDGKDYSLYLEDPEKLEEILKNENEDF